MTNGKEPVYCRIDGMAGIQNMKLGVIIRLDDNVGESMRRLREMGFTTCQLNSWTEENMTDDYAALVREATEANGIEVSAFWCGYTGPRVWNFISGPSTLGLVPSAYRFQRMNTLIQGAEFANKIGVCDVVTHVGFIPENPADPDYIGTVEAVRCIAEHLKKNGQYFLFETGQETPVTLLRIIEDVGTGNLGVNLDPANLLLYGKGNPVDALDIIGKHVRGVHAKDGEYPTQGRFLGEEKALGEGRVNFPVFIGKLKTLGYNGALTIEREISGDKQIKDILKAKELLESLI